MKILFEIHKILHIQSITFILMIFVLIVPHPWKIEATLITLSIWMFFVIVSHCEENKTTNEVMAHPHFFVILSWIGIWKYSNGKKLFKTIPQRLTVRIFEVFNIYDHEIVVRWEELLTPIFFTFVGLVLRNVCIIECRNHVAEKNINTMVVT